MSDALTLEQVEKQRDDARVVIVRLSAENAALRAQVAAAEKRWHDACTHDSDLTLPDQVADLTAQLATANAEIVRLAAALKEILPFAASWLEETHGDEYVDHPLYVQAQQAIKEAQP